MLREVRGYRKDAGLPYWFLWQLLFNPHIQAVMVQYHKRKRIKHMRQFTLATGTFETHRKPTHREKFLSDMEKGLCP